METQEYQWDFCSPDAPCGLDEGDCDHDGHCMGNLVCAKNCSTDKIFDCCKKDYQPPKGRLTLRYKKSLSFAIRPNFYFYIVYLVSYLK